MTVIEAVYENGVFRPVGSVALPDKQRVQLSIAPVPSPAGPSWLDELRQERERVAAAYGPFPDMTALIAEDRRQHG